jgi:maleamate amidohydrolase
MGDSFEDHCWKSVVPSEILRIYKHYRREVKVGPAAALVAIDLYELSYQGGPLPVTDLVDTYPSSCGIHAWEAIEPTKRLFVAARAAGLPIFYSTVDCSRNTRPDFIRSTNRKSTSVDPAAYEIHSAFKPQPGDVIIRKQRASAFFGTPLIAHLTQLGVRSILLCGESTSGCVRATAVDAYSLGFHVTMVEECCFDRSPLSHQVNLFDLHHKYADVMHLEEVMRHLERGLALEKAG